LDKKAIENGDVKPIPKSAINYFFVPEPVRRSFSEGGCLCGKKSV